MRSENVEIRQLSAYDGQDIYEMLQEIPKEENGYLNSANGLTYDEYIAWLEKVEKESLQEGIIDGWKVPSTTYWLYVDGKPVGMGKIRHFLTDALRKAGGNIGYAIVPGERGKGYGTLLLGFLLKEAKQIGIDQVLVTIHSDNAASFAVAKANGGVVEKEEDGRIFVWIDTCDR